MKHEISSPLPYRNGVGIMLLNSANNVFVAQRIDTPSNSWQMPQGGIDGHETPQEAALRELKEEIGTNNVKILCESKRFYTYDLPSTLIGKLWGGHYRGQRQKWFATQFLGHDSEINLQTDHPEFCAWQWVKMEQLPTLAVSFKHDTYQALIKEFKSLISPLS